MANVFSQKIFKGTAIAKSINLKNNNKELRFLWGYLMNKEEILDWTEKYDKDHPWWVQEEKRLGDKFRETKTLTKDDLYQIVEWKFKELEGRKKRVLGLVAKNSDKVIQLTCNQAFNLTLQDEPYRIDSLDKLHGVGPALASTILTFYDPKNYGIFDIHVWREFFGKEPADLFLTTKHYLQLLAELRRIANQYGFNVRTAEKAYFKKNLDESS